ncbi:cation:proton antiporter [Dongshaea marina]|uniref:cation:proton antiporter n=1 Tax=Dongshaea marina TaxID=2047966 RepID=UPI0019027FC7|nr:cation:proton antiporter [Dongshaea marina]
MLFGALISATDPVAVVALLKEVSSRKRLETLLEGESLLNDGTAIVLFTLFLTLAAGSAGTTPPQVVVDFLLVVCLGLIVGAAIGGVILGWIGRVFNDPLIEITLSVASAYLVFYVAEGVLHVSGVVAVVALALLFAGIGRTRISPEVAGFLHHFWEMLAHFANTLIFLMVGVLVAFRVALNDPVAWLALLGLYIAVMVIRGGTIFLFMPLLARIGIGITKEKAIVLWWGGLRGAVSLALALTVVQLELFPAELSDQVLFLCAGMVVLTIVINGTTMSWLLARLGLDRLPSGKQATVDKAQALISGEMQEMLPELQKNRFLAGADWDKIDEFISFDPKAEPTKAADEDVEIAFRRRLLETERQYYWTLFRQGTLGRSATQHLVDAVEHALDGTPPCSPGISCSSYGIPLRC